MATSPCNWDINYGPCDPPAEWDELEPEEKAVFEEMAVEFLWRWTGRALGACSVTIRPCRVDCFEGRSTFNGGGPGVGMKWAPVIINGAWTNIGCGRCGDSCGCDGGTPALRLPGPVTEITEVLVDGAPLDPAAYRVDNHSLLVRQDGQAWPTCQDLSQPPGAPGTWSVTYLQGVPVPSGGEIAAGTLAIELWKASCNDDSCALPQRVQSITRQGVTVAVLDAFDDVDTGHTGIWMIDSWVASIMKPVARSSVLSPDRPRPAARRQTWPTG